MERRLQIAADLLRAGLVVGSISYISFSTWQKHIGYAMGMMAIASIVLRFAKAPAVFDFTFVALLSIDCWATALGIVDALDQGNDRPGHLLISAAVTPILYYGSVRIKAVNASPANRAETLAVGLIALMMTVALGAVWELVEWQSDMRFGTDMSLGYSDTLGDLVCDLIGGFVGAAILVVVLGRQRAKAEQLKASDPPQAPQIGDTPHAALALDAIRE